MPLRLSISYIFLSPFILRSISLYYFSAWQTFEKYIFFLLLGLADDPSGSKNGIKAESHPTSGSSTGLRVLFIFLGLVAVVLFSIFLFKLYQKKKREEQHARLLRLFEEDDELELELGLREWNFSPYICQVYCSWGMYSVYLETI